MPGRTSDTHTERRAITRWEDEGGAPGPRLRLHTVRDSAVDPQTGSVFMSSARQAVGNVQWNNPYFRITKWVLHAGETTGLQPCASKSTIMSVTTGQFLLRNGNWRTASRPCPRAACRNRVEAPTKSSSIQLSIRWKSQ